MALQSFSAWRPVSTLRWLAAIPLVALAVAAGFGGCSSDDTGKGTSTCPASLGSACGAKCAIDRDCSTGLFCASGSCTADCSSAGPSCDSSGVCGKSGHCLSGKDPCDGALAAKCGGSCASDKDCTGGTYCGGGAACVADCVKSSDCSGGATCTAGRCHAGGLVLPDAGKTDSGGDACVSSHVDFSKQVPTVVVLVDQSGSMSTTFGSDSRWNVVHSALMNATTGFVPTLEKEVRFGIELYSGPQGVGAGDGQPSGKPCPSLTEVKPALNNAAAIGASYAADTVKNETPTGDAIDAVMTWFKDYKEPGPKVIVLATDGEPDTCEKPNPNSPAGNPEGRAEALAAATRAYGAGVSTFIISVGSEVGADHLQAMANVGRGLAVDSAAPAPYYAANNAAQLQSAFAEIIDGVRSCVLTLSGAIEKGKESSGKVSLDGKALTYQATDGWRVTDLTHVELMGASCKTIKSGDHQVDVEFPCGTFKPGPLK